MSKSAPYSPSLFTPTSSFYLFLRFLCKAGRVEPVTVESGGAFLFKNTTMISFARQHAQLHKFIKKRCMQNDPVPTHAQRVANIQKDTEMHATRTLCYCTYYCMTRRTCLSQCLIGGTVQTIKWLDGYVNLNRICREGMRQIKHKSQLSNGEK